MKVKEKKVLVLTEQELEDINIFFPATVEKKILKTPEDFVTSSLNRLDLFKLESLTFNKKVLAFLILARELGLEIGVEDDNFVAAIHPFCNREKLYVSMEKIQRIVFTEKGLTTKQS